MPQVVLAVYEHGVLRPLDRLDLPEHHQVRVTVEPVSSAIAGSAAAGHVDPLADLRVSTGIADLSQHFDDYRFGRRRP